MARTAIPLEKKIEIAQLKVVKAKENYDVAIEELKKLMDKRNALKKEKLIAAIEKSNKSYDDILEFINSDILNEG